jgi:outer membrane protein TolC
MSIRNLLLTGALVAPFFVPSPVRAQGAPAVPDTIRLTLEDAVVRAQRVSDEARLAAARVEVTEAQVTVARATGLPQLRVSGSYQRVFENARGQAVGQIFNQPNTYSANANLSQPLFQGGRAIAGFRAARRLRSAARFDERETRALLSLDVQRAYLDALLAERLLEIQASNLALSEERLAQLVELERGGRAARYDVLRARVERTNLEPQVIQARSDREIALLELKALLQIPAAQPVALASTVDPAGVQALLASYLVSDTAGARTQERAAVRAAELTAEARRDAIWVARADLLPTVSVFFQTGFGAFPTSNSFPSGAGRTSVVETPCRFVTVNPGDVCTAAVQNGGWFSDRLLGIQVSWPIFDGLRAKGNIDLAQAQARLADAELRQERERVELEAARARAELSRTRSLFEAQRQNAEEADEAFRLASLRFSRGLGTRLDVSDAQLARLTAQSNEARAVIDLYLAAAELARALGRPVPLPPTAPATVSPQPSGGAASSTTSTDPSSATARVP